MRRQGGGFGFVIMLLTLAVIFYVAMNNFKHIAPAAIDVKKHNTAREAGQENAPEVEAPKNGSPAASADSWTATPPTRPNLSTMDKNTTEHSAQVKDALSHAE
jgi:hypothetical protein